MRKVFRVLVWVFAGAFALELIAFAGAVGYYWYKSLPKNVPAVATLAPPKTDAERRAYNLAVFDAAWQAVDRNYYDRNFGGHDWAAAKKEYRPRAAVAKDSVELYWTVLKPMLNQLQDSHTAVAGPAVAAKPGECTFIADTLELALTRNRGTVISMVPKGSPAEQAGVEPDWKLQDYKLVTTKCGVGGIAELTEISPDRELHHFSYQARAQKPPPGRARTILRNGRMLLQFDEFTPDNIAWLETQLRTAPAKGVILDLRRNGGGIHYERVASAFLSANRPIGHFVTVNGISNVISSAPQVFRGPLAVLIGPASASAAEIVADVLRYNRRAVLVGRQTSGAVMGGDFFPLPDGGRVQVTANAYLNPAYLSLEGNGVKPDLDVQRTLAAIRAGLDEDVEAAQLILDAQAKTCGGGYCWREAAQNLSKR